VTRTQRVLARRWRSVALVAVLLFLSGAVGVSYLWISSESRRADDLAAEADLRGTAVSTLAGDVRALRQQVKAKGETPVAPDPTKAVKDLNDRAEVPVPIPGPAGPKGDKGDPGSPAPTITPSPGASGAAGLQGADGAAGSPGPAGPQGEPGPAGPQGETGEQGPPPDGWTYTDGQGVTYDCTPDSDNPKHYTCRRDSTPTPEPTDTPQRGLGLLAFVATATYRRL
jgi:hypothetical protein